MIRRSFTAALAALSLCAAAPVAAQPYIRSVSTETELVNAVASPTVPSAPSLDTIVLQNNITLTAPLGLPSGSGPLFDTGAFTLVGRMTGLGFLRKTGTGTLELTAPLSSPFGAQVQQGTLGMASGTYKSVDLRAAGVARADGTLLLNILSSSGGTLDTLANRVVADALTGALVKRGSGELSIYSTSVGASVDVKDGAIALLDGSGVDVTLDGGTLRSVLANSGLTLSRELRLGAAGGIVDASTEISLNDVSGVGSLTVRGGGVVQFLGRTTYTGGTLVETGATLFGTTSNVHGAIANNGSIFIGQFGDGDLQTSMAGSGQLFLLGSGTISLSGVNSHTGGTQLTGVTAVVGADNALGAANAGLTIDGATLRASASFGLSRGTTLLSHGAVFDTGAFTITAGTITGNGGLTKRGTGLLVLGGTTAYSGGTVVEEGTLQGNTATLQGHIANGATVVFDQAGNGTFAGDIVGGGTVRKTGTGTATFGAAQQYTGLTAVAGGRLNVAGLAGSAIVDAGATLGVSGSIAGAVTLNGTLAGAGGGFSLGSLEGSGGVQLGGGPMSVGTDGRSTTFAGTIAGAGGMTKVGAGALALSGFNTFTGGTIVSDGTLRFDADANLGAAGTALTLDGGTAQAGAALILGRTIATTARGGAFDTNGFNITLNGLTGAGAFTKAGAGILTIGNAATFSGSLRIDRGMVTAALAQLPSQIQNDAALNLAQGANGVYAGDISGTGMVIKDGAGALVFSQAQRYTGLTRVSAGELRIAGLAGGVSVDAGATLSGTGQIAGDAMVFGVLASGVSTAATRNLEATAAATAAPLSIAGNLTMQAGSTFTTSLAGGATYLNVGGRATFAGGALVLDGVKANVARTSTIPLFKAAGGVTGRFSKVTADAPVDAFLSSHGGNVLVTLERTDVPLSGLATTVSGAGVGAALDAARATASDDLHAVIGEVGALPDAEVGGALEQLSGSMYATAGRQGALEGQRAVRVVAERLADLRAQGAYEGSPAGGTVRPVSIGGAHLWVRSGADRTSLDAAAAESKVNGTVAGWDRVFGQAWTVGAFGGYESGTLTATDGQGRLEDRRYRGGGYVSRTAANGLFVDVAASVATHEYDSSRAINFVALLDSSLGGGALFGGVIRTAQAQPRAREVSGFVDAGMARRIGASAVQPFVGVEWSRVSRDGFTERGANAVDLIVDNGDASSARATAGVRASRTLSLPNGRWLSPRVEVRYAREMADVTGATTAAFADAPLARFGVESAAFGRHSATASAGVATTAGRRFVVSADYRGQFESDAQAHVFSLGVSF